MNKYLAKDYIQSIKSSFVTKINNHILKVYICLRCQFFFIGKNYLLVSIVLINNTIYMNLINNIYFI